MDKVRKLILVKEWLKNALPIVANTRSLYITTVRSDSRRSFILKKNIDKTCKIFSSKYDKEHLLKIVRVYSCVFAGSVDRKARDIPPLSILDQNLFHLHSNLILVRINRATHVYNRRESQNAKEI